MTREDLKLGQAVYLASFVQLPNETKDRVLVRSYEVRLLGKKFFELVGQCHRIKSMWASDMGTIYLLGESPEQAVEHLEQQVLRSLERARESLRRHEADITTQQAAIKEWKERSES